MAKNKKIEIRQDDIDFEAILICAVRYSLGRRTYMPGLVTDWIMEKCGGKLMRSTLETMKRDIEDYAKFNVLGDSCDVVTWTGFKKWINEELKEN